MPVATGEHAHVRAEELAQNLIQPLRPGIIAIGDGVPLVGFARWRRGFRARRWRCCHCRNANLCLLRGSVVAPAERPGAEGKKYQRGDGRGKAGRG